jgi:hypothetical protein
MTRGILQPEACTRDAQDCRIVCIAGMTMAQNFLTIYDGNGRPVSEPLFSYSCTTCGLVWTDARGPVRGVPLRAREHL